MFSTDMDPKKSKRWGQEVPGCNDLFLCSSVDVLSLGLSGLSTWAILYTRMAPWYKIPGRNGHNSSTPVLI